MNNRQVAEAFARGETKGNGNNMFIENNVLFSYGYHFPLAVRVAGGFLFNVDRYSNSTSKHQCHVRAAFAKSGLRVIESNTKECLAVLSNGVDGVPVVLERVAQPKSIVEVEEVLTKYMASCGVRFARRHAKRLVVQICEIVLVSKI